MLPRYSYLALIAIAVVVASVGSYVYASSVLFPVHRNSPPMTVIHIPKGSSIPPPNWVDFTNLSSLTFHYPVNITVTIGVNKYNRMGER